MIYLYNNSPIDNFRKKSITATITNYYHYRGRLGLPMTKILRRNIRTGPYLTDLNFHKITFINLSLRYTYRRHRSDIEKIKLAEMKI